MKTKLGEGGGGSKRGARKSFEFPFPPSNILFSSEKLGNYQIAAKFLFFLHVRSSPKFGFRTQDSGEQGSTCRTLWAIIQTALDRTRPFPPRASHITSFLHLRWNNSDGKENQQVHFVND